MKTIKIFSLGFLTLLMVQTESIYSYSVPKIEGGNQSLMAFQNKKLLVVTLPCQQSGSADSMLRALDTLALARLSQLQVLAVPAYEDGFTPQLKNQLKQWYRSKLGNYILITDGLYTRKTSGSQQHDLFKWLTTESMNESFNMDVEGPEFKFFVNPAGELNGVLKKVNRINGAAVQKAIQLN